MKQRKFSRLASRPVPAIRRSWWPVLLALVCLPPGRAGAETGSDEGLEFFETRIRPVLVEHCYKCHSAEAKMPKGDLRLDTREGMRAGGQSGHAVVPNEVNESLILDALRYESFEMPPSGRLDETIIADFEAWIRMGAPDPRDEPTAEVQPPRIDLQQGREYWAFQSPRAPAPPTLPDDDWSYGEIDRFLRTRQQQAGVVPVSDADRAALLRRVYFDLIGLPPTAAELAAFVADPSPDAYRKVVDRLLESPHFGERWGRHWLDVVRYAESTGRTRNFPYPFAWRYRDYVIRSFQEDKPYDRFVVEQLAGDLLPADSDAQRDEQRIATGFLALGAHDLNENNNAVFAMDVAGDQIDVTGRTLMALTLGCARCHDHKFDPLPTADYYALAGIFRSSELLGGYTNRRRNRQYADPDLYLKLTSVADPAAEATEPVSQRPAEASDEPLQQRIRRARQELNRLRKLAEQPRDAQAGTPQPGLAKLQQQLRAAQQRLRRLMAGGQQDGAPATPMRGPYAMGVRDAERIADCPIHEGGDVNRLGGAVPRGFLQVIDLPDSPAPPADQSGRLELARWLTRPDHPLTSRVMVNRIWHHLFGQGIVTTVDNFGAMGSRPSHPELLDYLAVRFVEDGWSVKRLIRSIVLSHAYQLSSADDPHNLEIDADNQLVWRMPLRRLEAEAIRDAILVVSGQLQPDPPAGSPLQELPIAPIRPRVPLIADPAQFNYRSVYMPIVRGRVPEYLMTFDFPEPSDVKGARDVTTVATQALFMMNSPLVQYHSRLAAEQFLREERQPREVVRQAYLSTLSREPSEQQLQRALEYLQAARRASDRPPRAAWVLAVSDLVQALIGSAEFRYR